MSSGRHTSRKWWALVPAAVGVVLLVTATVLAPTVPAVAGSTENADVTDVAHRYEAALVEHDWGALEALVADDFTFHYTEYGATQHRRGFLAWARLTGDAYLDFILSPDRVLVDRDLVTIWFHERLGNSIDLATPGVGVVSGVVRLHIAHGLIVEMWSNYDEFGALRLRANLGPD